MHERVGLAVIALNEAEAFHRVEELYRPAGLLSGELALRPALCALDGHRLALDPKVGCRDSAAAVDERELERLSVSQVGQARLLDRRDVHEHILAAVIADDEAEALLRVEEFDDALAFADDLGRHSATTAATKATATAAAAESTTAAAVTAATAAAEAAAVAIATAATSAAEAAAFLIAAAEITCEIVFAETVALVAAAPAAVPLAPSIETHAPSEYLSPPTPQTNALGPNGATGHGA
jgi:hypothetical protein